MKKATKNQLRLIKDMELLLNIKFNGTTIKEASDFISKHYQEYKKAQDFIFELTSQKDIFY